VVVADAAELASPPISRDLFMNSMVSKTDDLDQRLVRDRLDCVRHVDLQSLNNHQKIEVPDESLQLQVLKLVALDQVAGRLFAEHLVVFFETE
jgi:hypothetical protein